MRILVIGLVAVLLAVPLRAPLAQTADYPFTGFFADTSVDDSAGTAAARCALGFFEQRGDGSYAYYHLDTRGYEAGHRISYLEYAKGECSFDPGRKIEICNSKADLSSRDDQTYSTFAVFSRISPESIAYSSYDSIDEARAAVAAQGVSDAEEQGEYRRCPADPSRLRGLIAPGMSNYSEDDIGALADPAGDTLNGTLAAEVAKALAGK